MTGETLSRRQLGALLGGAAALLCLPAAAADRPLVTVRKDPACGCCSGWVDHLSKAGFPTKVLEARSISQVKKDLGIPTDLWSCHTAEIAGYVLEGHVPVAAIERLLAERPRATGLAVPGMPVGSPGMEVDGTPPEVYEVVLFGPSGSTGFGRYKGGDLQT
jgi:hypothetical protein